MDKRVATKLHFYKILKEAKYKNIIMIRVERKKPIILLFRSCEIE